MPIYMHIEKVEGTVARKRGGKKTKWIELRSAQFNVPRTVSSPAGRGVNREESPPTVTELVVTKDLDAASDALFKLSVWGDGKTVVIHFVEAGEHVTEKEPYLVLELKNTLIAGYTVAGHGVPDGGPTESLSLNFLGIKYTTSILDKPPATRTGNIRMSPL